MNATESGTWGKRRANEHLVEPKVGAQEENLNVHHPKRGCWSFFRLIIKFAECTTSVAVCNSPSPRLKQPQGKPQISGRSPHPSATQALPPLGGGSGGWGRGNTLRANSPLLRGKGWLGQRPVRPPFSGAPVFAPQTPAPTCSPYSGPCLLLTPGRNRPGTPAGARGPHRSGHPCWCFCPMEGRLLSSTCG